MKKINLIQYLLFIMVILINANCKKEIQSGERTTLNPPAPVNTAPVVIASNEFPVILPDDFCILSGFAWDSESNIKSYRWKKISGPLSYTFENQDSLSTKVRNLRKGVYEFELTVTDKEGLTGKDTTTVTVIEMKESPNEIIIHDLVWIFPWYNSIEVMNFHKMIPKDTFFRVFIKRDTNPDWVEAYPISNNGSGGQYEYFVETRPYGAGMYNYGSLYIFYYGTDISDKPDIKLVY